MGTGGRTRSLKVPEEMSRLQKETFFLTTYVSLQLVHFSYSMSNVDGDENGIQALLEH